MLPIPPFTGTISTTIDLSFYWSTLRGPKTPAIPIRKTGVTFLRLTLQGGRFDSTRAEVFINGVIMGKWPYTLPSIIMEVENGPLEDELSLQKCNFPLPGLLEKDYSMFSRESL